MTRERILQVDSMEGRLVSDELNRYFTGKYMAARDFACDQDYFRSHLRSLALASVGWGIADGLEVTWREDETCAHWVTVKAGIAIDPVGRQLILTEDVPIELEINRNIILGLRLVEQGIEPVPVLVQNAATSPDDLEPGRIRETPEIIATAPGQLAPNAWFGPRPWDGDNVFSTEEPGTGSDAHRIVPLAYVTWPEQLQDANAERHEDHSGVPRPEVHMVGRRCLVVDGGTRIAAYNWTHGGTSSVSDLEKWDYHLLVAFTSPLLDPSNDGQGLGPMTLRVRYRDEAGRICEVEAAADQKEWYLTDLPGTARQDSIAGAEFISRDDAAQLWMAAYKFDPNALNALAGTTIEITLICDLVADHLGRAVNGSHPIDRLPIGNGRAGGTFESWVTITDDAKADAE